MPGNPSVSGAVGMKGRGRSRESHVIVVILAAHGEAEGPGFREHFAVSWRTLAHAAEVMPLPAAARVGICGLGALRKRLDAKAGSRHNAMTRTQARELAVALEDDSDSIFRVVPAFASADPGVGNVLTTVPDDATVLLMSMIPTDSRLACGIFCRAVAARPGGREARPAVRPVARLWEDPGLVAVHRAHVDAWLAAHRGESSPTADSALVIVLHGTLLEGRDGRPPPFHTGQREKAHYGEALRRALADRPDRPWRRIEIAYLNHAVGGRWSQPALEDCLEELARDGIRCVYAYPAEHVVESAETGQLAQIIASSPVDRGHCLPCLNDAPVLIDFLVGRVRAAVTSGATAPCDHCPLA